MMQRLLRMCLLCVALVGSGCHSSRPGASAPVIPVDPEAARMLQQVIGEFAREIQTRQLSGGPIDRDATARSISALERIQARDPSNALPYYLIAYAYSGYNDWGRAWQWLRAGNKAAVSRGYVASATEVESVSELYGGVYAIFGELSSGACQEALRRGPLDASVAEMFEVRTMGTRVAHTDPIGTVWVLAGVSVHQNAMESITAAFQEAGRGTEAETYDNYKPDEQFYATGEYKAIQGQSLQEQMAESRRQYGVTDAIWIAYNTGQFLAPEAKAQLDEFRRAWKERDIRLAGDALQLLPN